MLRYVPCLGIQGRLSEFKYTAVHQNSVLLQNTTQGLKIILWIEYKYKYKGETKAVFMTQNWP